jgi:ABC-type lipoprotein release transport system permease subunit
MLMKGAVLRKNKQKKEAKAKKKTASKKGSLYSRLIIRNMIQDKARVSVTIAIIAFSCMLIGLGISLKFAYNGMMDGQESVVNRFDIRMDMNDDVSDEDEEALVRVLEENKAGFMPAAVESTLYRWNNRLDGVSLICADPEKISEFYGVVDPKTGKDIELPENGILIQKRIHESYGMDPGDSLTVLDSSLREHDAEIRGTFVNYVGRTIVTSQEAYRSIFGKDSDANCYFIKLNGADREKLEEELLAVSDNISFEANNEFRMEYEAGTIIYDILVFTTTGIAILISFMILTNLANIYLTRKKTELTIMRVNGFRIKEAKGYLSRESILTTAAGLALGVAVGAVFTPFAINYMQQPDLEFVKTFQPVAWMAAVVLEALFSIVINTLVYRKVKDLNLRDIA